MGSPQRRHRQRRDMAGETPRWPSHNRAAPDTWMDPHFVDESYYWPGSAGAEDGWLTAWNSRCREHERRGSPLTKQNRERWGRQPRQSHVTPMPPFRPAPRERSDFMTRNGPSTILTDDLNAYQPRDLQSTQPTGRRRQRRTDTLDGLYPSRRRSASTRYQAFRESRSDRQSSLSPSASQRSGECSGYGGSDDDRQVAYRDPSRDSRRGSPTRSEDVLD